MSRQIYCKKFKAELEGLDNPPFPGPAGMEIYNNVSKKAWKEWLAHQTRIINEKQLELFDPKTQSYLNQEREKFFNNQAFARAEGFTPPIEDKGA